ncbi:MAG: primase [Proteobacteria bacterium]|nr:primase [Pseudomonadota bacterium]
MTTPPLPGIRDAFSSADFLASAEGADQAAPAEGDQAAPAEPPKADRGEPDSKDKRVRDEYYRNLARNKGEDFARKIGKAEGISHDEMTDILFPKTKGKSKRRGKTEEGEPDLPPSPPPADDASEDDGWKRRKDPIKPLPEGCPIVPVGQLGAVYYYLKPSGEILSLKAAEHNANGLRALAEDRIDFFWQTFPKFNETTRQQTGWKVDQASESLMTAAAARGKFVETRRVRGLGAWLDDDGGLVLHVGDAVWINGAWQKPGLYGDKVYSAQQPVVRPADAFVPAKECTEPVLNMLDSWNWANEADETGTLIDHDGSGHRLGSMLALGLWAAGLMGGALKWRPHGWITGDSGDGKSTLLELLEHLYGPETLVTSTDPTAAGIWSELGFSTRPILLDESEPDPTSDRVQKLVKLARVAAKGGLVLRGSSDHTATAFLAQSVFLFGSIIIPPLLGQDVNRFVVLELQKLGERPALVMDVKQLRLWGAMIKARIIGQWSRWPETLVVYRQALATGGHTARGQDVYGTVLALLDLMRGDEICPSDMRSMLADALHTARGGEGPSEVSNAQAMLNHILSVPLDVFRGGTRMTIEELVLAAVGGRWDEREAPCTPAQARDALRAHGVYVSGRADNAQPQKWHSANEPPTMVALPNQNEGLRRIFDGTTWYGMPGTIGGWAQAMKRLGAAPVNSRSLGGRGWSVSARTFLQLDR